MNEFNKIFFTILSAVILLFLIVLTSCSQTTTIVRGTDGKEIHIQQSTNSTVTVERTPEKEVITSDQRNPGILESGFQFIANNIKTLVDGVKGIFRNPEAQVEL